MSNVRHMSNLSAACKADFLKFWSHIPWNTQSEELIVLKGHLLVEDLLREFCESRVAHPEELDAARLSFTQIVQLARALHPHQAPGWIWGAVGKLNSVRNMLAHRLLPTDLEKSKGELIALCRAEAGQELYQAFSQPFEHLGISVFLTYSALSACLRMEPQSLLARTLLG